MPPAAAADLARDALLWLLGRPDDLGAFMGASGLDLADLRARAGEPEFLGFVLDFLLADEALLGAFAAEAGLPPDAPRRARLALPGGDVPEWT
jgi:hypothetical protein